MENPRLAQDLAFLKQVESLAGTASSAIEEAESYANEIKDEKLREKAQQILDQI